jgi:hypothetical protein
MPHRSCSAGTSSTSAWLDMSLYWRNDLLATFSFDEIGLWRAACGAWTTFGARRRTDAAGHQPSLTTGSFQASRRSSWRAWRCPSWRRSHAPGSARQRVGGHCRRPEHSQTSPFERAGTTDRRDRLRPMHSGPGQCGPVAWVNSLTSAVLGACSRVHRRWAGNVDHKNRIRSRDTRDRLPCRQGRGAFERTIAPAESADVRHGLLWRDAA